VCVVSGPFAFLTQDLLHSLFASTRDTCVQSSILILNRAEQLQALDDGSMHCGPVATTVLVAMTVLCIDLCYQTTPSAAKQAELEVQRGIRLLG
jgi:hypothetical protein